MQKYQEKQFDIPELKGISKTNIEEHLKLYSGYVKNTNNILEKVSELSEDIEANQFTLTEMQRRFSFEFNGMRNHEYYFGALEGGPTDLSDDSELKTAIEKEWGSFDKWFSLFKSIAKTRGVGWVNLYYDKETNQLLNGWVDEQHLGHLNGLQPILCLDMWEHSFVADYQPSGKGQYIDDFFTNLNWQKIEESFTEARK
ncbi:superoxide dismutase [Candidatus Parcubacteria bacterium]|nr:superoxide dismutase [Candidatus Parcubacteria bacterium]